MGNTTSQTPEALETLGARKAGLELLSLGVVGSNSRDAQGPVIGIEEDLPPTLQPPTWTWSTPGGGCLTCTAAGW